MSDRGSVVCDDDTTVGGGAVQDETIRGTRQAKLLDCYDVQIRARSADRPKNVMAGVFVPEEASHRFNRARRRC